MGTHPTLARAALGGFVGTLVMTGMMYFVAPMMDVRMDIATMLGSMLGGSWIAGMMMHFVLGWSRVLPRIDLRRALRVSLLAMLAVSLGLMLLNHMGGQPIQLRWTLTAVIAVLIMVESGFTPAALSLLAATVGRRVGRGATMGI